MEYYGIIKPIIKEIDLRYIDFETVYKDVINKLSKTLLEEN